MTTAAPKKVLHRASYDGHIFTRTSARIYTHAVIYRYNESAYGRHANSWSVTFSQSLANAERERKARLGFHNRAGVRLIDEAYIVPVERAA